MIILLSPSKTLDFDVPALPKHSVPDLLGHSKELIAELKKLSVNRISQLMDISEKLAVLNHERYQQFITPFTGKNAKQAIAIFQGDVYDGLNAADFNAKDYEFAQDHLRILSGLYGILRPLDLIQPYRLEMGTHLKTKKGKDLYAFWGDKITSLVKELQGSQKDSHIINLASQEYFKVVQPKVFLDSVITPVFKEKKGDSYKIVMIYAKRARGTMARYIIKHRLVKAESIKDFKEDGYTFSESLSNEKEWVFVR